VLDEALLLPSPLLSAARSTPLSPPAAATAARGGGARVPPAAVPCQGQSRGSLPSLCGGTSSYLPARTLLSAEEKGDQQGVGKKRRDGENSVGAETIDRDDVNCKDPPEERFPAVGCFVLTLLYVLSRCL